MNFSEAVTAVIEGKKVRCVGWDNGCVWYRSENKLIDERKKDYLPCSAWHRKEWELVNPKATIKITVEVNGKTTSPKEISEETWNNIRNNAG